MMHSVILNSSIIEIDLTELLLEYTFYKNKFIELRYMTKGDQLCIWDYKIYIDDKPEWLRPITRPMFGQSRYIIQDYMSKEMKLGYIALLDKIQKYEKIVPKTHVKYLSIKDMIDKNIQFINSILPGIVLLKSYYEEYPPNINISLNPIIYSFTQFKNKYDNLEKKNS
jgi:hypothetical protein